ncbi:thioredoxin domain-containing protein [Candidatus Roizmanbacteria bacterium]|nr:thioredoxin domain-containing protein [Candidatus Roizmanbacteria bacterium]
MQKKGNALIIILLVVVSFAAGYFFFKVKNLEQGKTLGTSQQNPPQQQAQQESTEFKIKKPDSKEHWNGVKNVRYVWVEYSDLECPFCQKIHPDLTKLLNVYSGKIAWVYRHFPLPSHSKAQKSAEATECANELGGNDAFWKMADIIFEKMPGLELSELPSLASQIGLDESKFRSCLDSGKFEKKVKDQLAEGEKAGVRATPTNVIYDMKTRKTSLIEGALPYEDLRKSLDTFISQNK